MFCHVTVNLLWLLKLTLLCLCKDWHILVRTPTGIGQQFCGHFVTNLSRHQLSVPKITKIELSLIKLLQKCKGHIFCPTLYIECDCIPSNNCVIVFGIAANTITNMPVCFIPTTSTACRVKKLSCRRKTKQHFAPYLQMSQHSTKVMLQSIYKYTVYIYFILFNLVERFS